MHVNKKRFFYSSACKLMLLWMHCWGYKSYISNIQVSSKCFCYGHGVKFVKKNVCGFWWILFELKANTALLMSHKHDLNRLVKNSSNKSMNTICEVKTNTSIPAPPAQLNADTCKEFGKSKYDNIWEGWKEGSALRKLFKISFKGRKLYHPSIN